MTHYGEDSETVEGRIWAEETTMEDPTVDMDWDDEEFDQTSMDFYEELAGTQERLLAMCLELVETDGELIEGYED